jgi:hypothetical protein
MIVGGQFVANNPSYHTEEIHFADGTVWNEDDLLELVGLDAAS